jgi:hypothetical protein
LISVYGAWINSVDVVWPKPGHLREWKTGRQGSPPSSPQFCWFHLICSGHSKLLKYLGSLIQFCFKTLGEWLPGFLWQLNMATYMEGWAWLWPQSTQECEWCKVGQRSGGHASWCLPALPAMVSNTEQKASVNFHPIFFNYYFL